MPTKHIDDATAAELDDLYVRCVTLTQQPVKEVEVLRLAIQKGINNIVDDDILSAMSVKDSVWQAFAETVWAQITAAWPAEGVDSDIFDRLAAEYSPLWRQHPSEKCQKHIRERIGKGRFPELTLHERLFTSPNPFTDGREPYTETAKEEKTADFDANRPSLQGKKFSEQPQEQRDLLLHSTLNKQGIILQPDGSGDFTIQIEEPTGDIASENAAH